MISQFDFSMKNISKKKLILKRIFAYLKDSKDTKNCKNKYYPGKKPCDTNTFPSAVCSLHWMEKFRYPQYPSINDNDNEKLKILLIEKHLQF